MINSPQRPPARQLSTQQSSGQLLDELEALTQALYQSQTQQKNFPVQFEDAGVVVGPHARHSVSTGALPSVFDQKHAASNLQPRFTSSTFESKPFSTFGDQGLDVRSRKDRRASLQLNHSSSGRDIYAPEEAEWPDNAADVSVKIDSASRDKKKGLWNWKPLRALSHIGRQRFHCMFSAHAQSAKGLPSAVNGLRLTVHIRKEESKEGAMQTMPSRVFQGFAEFEETLFLKCSVYGSKGRSNTIKFMPKVFIVSVVATDVDGLDFGKHRIDLSCLLPQYVDGKGEIEKGNVWNANLDLSGKAKGGKLCVTFGYEVLDKDSNVSASILNGASKRRASMQGSYSLPNSAHGSPLARSLQTLSPSVSELGTSSLAMEQLSLDDVVIPFREQRGVVDHRHPQFQADGASQVAFGQPEAGVRRLSQDMDHAIKSAATENNSGYAEGDEDGLSDNDNDFTVVEQGVEIDEIPKLNNEKVKDDDPKESYKLEVSSRDKAQEESRDKAQEESSRDKAQEESSRDKAQEESSRDKAQEESSTDKAQEESSTDKAQVEEGKVNDVEIGEDGKRKETVTYQMVMKTLDSLLQGTSAKERAHLEMLDAMPEVKGKLGEDDRVKIAQAVMKGLGETLDDEADLVAGEFLEMLGSKDDQNSESESDSPRARLLKQFENESLLQGGFLVDANIPEKLDLDEMTLNAKQSSLQEEKNKEQISFTTLRSAKYQRDALSVQKQSVEAQEKLLEEKAALKNTPKFQESEPLGKGLGATINVKDGGTLRSMNPVHFQSERCTGKLVMQVSKPIVLPAEIGSGTLDILRNMAAMGIENMAVQALTAMPLEELMGKSMEQIAMEGLDAGKFSRIRAAWGSSFKLKSTLTKSKQQLSSIINDNKDPHVSLENIAPAAMHQLEFLAMNGLKIQAGMSDEEAPYALHAFSIDSQSGGTEARRDGGPVSLKGVTGVRLLKGAKVPAQTAGEGKGLMDMAITLDEWMLLDAGFGGQKDKSDDTLAIMAAHRGRKRSDSEDMSMQWGCMGNTLTVAMLVQFRDPSRALEAIGAPMIALVQAERVTVPKLQRRNSLSSLEVQPDSLFKITGIYMAGARSSQDTKRPGWGSQRQFRAASRWLLANGMAESKPASGKSKARQGNCLWSISAQLLGSTNKWKDLMKMNPHIRNPDVLY